MKLGPGKDESQMAATEIAIHDLQIVNSDLGFALGMASMEMREAVIVEEHDDGDPEEATDRRHMTSRRQKAMFSPASVLLAGARRVR